MAGWGVNGAFWEDYDGHIYSGLDFGNAYNERRAVLGDSAEGLPAEGWDLQGLTFDTLQFGWKEIQDWIATNCTSFVQSHDTDGTPRAAGYYDNKATIDMWTFANVMKAVAAGDATMTDFRRATTMPADWPAYGDAAYSYGRAAAGDIIGPWIFYDIQAALNLLIWTGPTYTWTDLDQYRGIGTSTDPGATWAEAQTNAENDWQDHTDPTVARSFTAGEHDVSGSPSVYSASAFRSQTEATVVDLPTTLACAVEWYIKTEPGEGNLGPDHADFGDNDGGDPVYDGKFGLWLTDARGTGAATFTSTTKLGDAVFPDWCISPDDVEIEAPDEHTHTLGWQESAAGLQTVLRWNVTNGFSYF